MGWIKTERRTQRTLTCWHVLLSAFQGGFSLFAPLCSGRRRHNCQMGPTPLEMAGELYSRCLVYDWHRPHSLGEWGCRGSRGGSRVSESFVLNQTNTVEFLPLLVQKAEWQGRIAEVPVSRNHFGSKCDHPLPRNCPVYLYIHIICYMHNVD